MQQLVERHSLSILKLLTNYEDFLGSLTHVVDMGCGSGTDVEWWATLKNNNDPPEPYNFNCFAVDTDGAKLAQVPNRKNIHKIQNSFDADFLLPVPVDFIWAHDCLQYSVDPMHTLKMWNSYLNVNGMLVVTVPQHTGIEYHKQYSRSYNGCIYHYTPLMLIYMLALNGFDCRDAYLLKQFQDPWIHFATYKTDIAPMDPQTTTWFDLADRGLLHHSIVSSLNTNGFVKQEEIVMPWLNKELYFIDYVSQRMDFPPATETTGAPSDEIIQAEESTIDQAKKVERGTKLLKPRPLLTKPPTRKSYKNA